MYKHAFTLIELIVAIVIIGVLGAVAIPQFGSLIDNSKISSEKATATSIQTTLDTIHSDWTLNGANCQFEWGNGQVHLDGNDLNDDGYPKHLDGGTSDDALSWLFENSEFEHYNANRDQYIGPASNPDGGVSEQKAGEPNIGDYWQYSDQNGTFTLIEN